MACIGVTGKQLFAISTGNRACIDTSLIEIAAQLHGFPYYYRLVARLPRLDKQSKISIRVAARYNDHDYNLGEIGTLGTERMS